MKNQCSYQQEVERWFDGEHNASDSLKAHIDSCETCSAHIAFLTECREAIDAMPAAPKIADAQMSAFLEGIAEGVHEPRRRFTGLWAMASAVTAALIVAVSAMTIMSTGLEPVVAESFVETVSTDIDGATVEIVEDDFTTPTIWLHLPEGGEI
jgi:hypothetical protein